jgi:hypothetical protein
MEGVGERCEEIETEGDRKKLHVEEWYDLFEYMDRISEVK